MFLLLLGQLFIASAQLFKMDTLQFKGDTDKYINVVIMGDGYTATEQEIFIQDARSIFNTIYGQPPWSNYLNYFNAFAIRVISEQSGAKHPNTASDCNSASPHVPVSSPHTYFDSSFDSYDIHRLVIPNNVSNIVQVLSSHFPNYDQVLIIANSSFYGGSGGAFATSTKESMSSEIMAHEMGHSFGYLADEYYVGDQYSREQPNMTQQTDPSLIKWKNWMKTNQVGIFQHCCGGNSAQWYKPHENCKMQFLGRPFCSVCSETIIERIHQLVNPVVSYLPLSSTVNSPERLLDFKLTGLMKPMPNTLKITWELDGKMINSNMDSVKIDQSLLSGGIHTLNCMVADTSTLVRLDSHRTDHFSLVSWTIHKTPTNIRLGSTDNQVAFSVFPNPSKEFLTISIEMDKRAELAIHIISAEGKMIRQVSKKAWVNGTISKTISIADLPPGAYILRFNVGRLVKNELFVKQ